MERPLLLRGLLAEVEPRESVVDPLDPGGSRFRPAVPVVLGAALWVTEDLEGPLNLPETLLDDAVVGVQIRMQAPREAPVRLTDPQDVGVAPDPLDRVVVGGRGHGERGVRRSGQLSPTTSASMMPSSAAPLPLRLPPPGGGGGGGGPAGSWAWA
ncbi:MAG: hypothetical protein F4174_11095, partial [Acidobacteria bacterium]|nr:hypothetical protein [Acidobacteriota bacterium]